MSNREVKGIMAKTMNANWTDWSQKLDDSLQAYQTTFKTLIGMSLYQHMFGKSFHIPMQLDHKAMCVLKKLNFNWEESSKRKSWVIA